MSFTLTELGQFDSSNSFIYLTATAHPLYMEWSACPWVSNGESNRYGVCPDKVPGLTLTIFSLLRIIPIGAVLHHLNLTYLLRTESKFVLFFDSSDLIYAPNKHLLTSFCSPVLLGILWGRRLSSCPE